MRLLCYRQWQHKSLSEVIDECNAFNAPCTDNLTCKRHESVTVFKMCVFCVPSSSLLAQTLARKNYHHMASLNELCLVCFPLLLLQTKQCNPRSACENFFSFKRILIAKLNDKHLKWLEWQSVVGSFWLCWPSSFGGCTNRESSSFVKPLQLRICRELVSDSYEWNSIRCHISRGLRN